MAKIRSEENEKQKEVKKEKVVNNIQKLENVVPDPIVAAVVCNHLEQVFLPFLHFHLYPLFVPLQCWYCEILECEFWPQRATEGQFCEFFG